MRVWGLPRPRDAGCGLAALAEKWFRAVVKFSYGFENTELRQGSNGVRGCEKVSVYGGRSRVSGLGFKLKGVDCRLAKSASENSNAK